MTRYGNRAVLNGSIAEMMQEQAKNLNTRLFQTTIREAVVVRESQINQQSIFDYSPRANVTKDFENFIDELLKGVNHE